MSRKTELLALTKNQGLTEFKFFLDNDVQGLVELAYAPDGWVGSGVTYERSPKYKGVFRSFSTNELSFPKDGRDYIQNVKNGQGVNGDIRFIVKELNSTTYEYDDYFEGKIDISTAQIGELFSVVQIIDSNFTEKVKNRDDINVDLNSLVSIGGTELQIIAGTYSIHEITSVWTTTLGEPFDLVNLPVKLALFSETQTPNLSYGVNDDEGAFMLYLAIGYSLNFSLFATGKVFSSIINSSMGAIIKIRVISQWAPFVTDHEIWSISDTNTDEIPFTIDEELLLYLRPQDKLVLTYQTLGDDVNNVQIQFDTLSFEYIQGNVLDLELPEYGLEDVANWRYIIDPAIPNYSATHIVPLTLSGSNFTEAQTPVNAPNDKTGAILFEAQDDYVINLALFIQGIFTVISYPFNFSFYYIVLDSAGVEKSKTLIQEFNTTDYSPRQFSVYYPSAQFNMSTGDSLLIQCDFNGLLEVEYSSATCEINVTADSLSAIIIGAYPTYEAWLTLCQRITDETSPFYSDFFGRVDSVLQSYPSDGEISHITKGLPIRGGSIINNTINVSLSKMFDSFNPIHNLGLGIETIDGVNKVRVESWEYFFDNNVILDISGRIDENTIVNEVLPEWHYNQIFAGWQDFLHEVSGGLYEFNTKYEYSTVINLKNTLDIISEYRGDTQGIALLREKPISTNPTEDVKGDSDIFIIASKRKNGVGSGFIARQDENFESVIGGAGASQNYNLDYTPARNLRNHGSIIRAGGLELHLNTYIRWLGSNKNTSLITKKAGEDEIVENADIQVNDLDTPYWLPEAYVCEVPIYAADLAAIEANPYGLIKLSDTKYGWILKIQSDSESRMGELRLLRVDLNYITPIEP